MLSRIWHGYTTVANADAYEQLLRERIFPGIMGRQIPGFRGIDLLRRQLAFSVEFITIMWFDSIDAVIAFAGEQYEQSVVPPEARELLQQFDVRSEHYAVVERLAGRPGDRHPDT